MTPSRYQSILLALVASGIAAAGVAGLAVRETRVAGPSVHVLFGDEPGHLGDSGRIPASNDAQTPDATAPSPGHTGLRDLSLEAVEGDQPDSSERLADRSILSLAIPTYEDEDGITAPGVTPYPSGSDSRTRSIRPGPGGTAFPRLFSSADSWSVNPVPLISAAPPLPTPGFFGPGMDGASRIVFVCDPSGSMLNKMATLKNELAKAVNGLNASQSFNMVFFGDENCYSLDKKGLVPANAANKKAAYRFLDDITTSGTTDSIPGLKFAFGLHPDVIYLIEDGDLPDDKQALATVRASYRLWKARVNTIAFVDEGDTDTDSDFPDNKQVLTTVRASHQLWNAKVKTVAFQNDTDSDTDFIDLLKQIAEETGGIYRHVWERDLER